MQITVTLHLDDSFWELQKIVRQEAELRKCRCWIDRDRLRGDAGILHLEDTRIRLTYPTGKGEIELSAPYDDILSVAELRKGILIRLNKGRMLFLPVTGNGKDNETLIHTLTLLTAKCRHTYKIAALGLPGVNLFQRLSFYLRSDQGIYLGSGHVYSWLILLSLFSIFVGTVFTSMLLRTTEITRQEAVPLTGLYQSHDAFVRRHTTRYIDIQFYHGEEQTVDGCCSSDTLLEKLNRMTPGTEMTLLLHPVTDDVLEIRVADNVLLKFDNALSNLRREATGFFFLGLLMYFCAGYLIVGVLRKKL